MGVAKLRRYKKLSTGEVKRRETSENVGMLAANLRENYIQRGKSIPTKVKRMFEVYAKPGPNPYGTYANPFGSKKSLRKNQKKRKVSLKVNQLRRRLKNGM